MNSLLVLVQVKIFFFLNWKFLDIVEHFFWYKLLLFSKKFIWYGYINIGLLTASAEKSFTDVKMNIWILLYDTYLYAFLTFFFCFFSSLIHLPTQRVFVFFFYTLIGKKKNKKKHLNKLQCSLNFLLYFYNKYKFREQWPLTQKRVFWSFSQIQFLFCMHVSL